MDIVNLFNEVLYRKPNNLELKFHDTDLEDKKNELLSCHERLMNHKMIIEKQGPSNLRIALMIVGHFRRFETSVNVWKTFKELHPDVDIFVHTWNSRGLRSDKNWILDNVDDKPDFETIYDTLSPVSFIREDHNKYLENFSLLKKCPNKNIYLSLGQKVDNHRDFSKFIMSQLYSIYKCHESVKNYEDHNQFKYDIIIKLRADTILYHPLIFKEKLSDDCLYIHSRSHFHRDGGRGCKKCDLEYKTKIRLHKEHSNDVCDVLLYGNSKVMERYCRMYINISELLDQFDKDNKENLEKWPINKNFVTKSPTTPIIYFSWCGDMDKNLKLLYPERMIREYMKDYWLLSDPFYL
jgi:hypothetical protein